MRKISRIYTRNTNNVNIVFFCGVLKNNDIKNDTLEMSTHIRAVAGLGVNAILSKEIAWMLCRRLESANPDLFDVETVFAIFDFAELKPATVKMVKKAIKFKKMYTLRYFFDEKSIGKKEYCLTAFLTFDREIYEMFFDGENTQWINTRLVVDEFDIACEKLDFGRIGLLRRFFWKSLTGEIFRNCLHSIDGMLIEAICDDDCATMKFIFENFYCSLTCNFGHILSTCGRNEARYLRDLIADAETIEEE